VSLDRARRRLARRAEAIRGDIARGALAEELADAARWFVAEASRAPRGTRELTITDWSSGEPRPKSFALDPAKLPREEIEAVFARARRMQKGRAIAGARLAETLEKLARIELALLAVESAETPEGVREATARGEGAHAARPGGEHARPIRAPRREEQRRLPYRTFVSALGTPIYVGRGAADNDALTFRVARPRDLWLHAHGTSGAHVILPLGKGKEPAPDALVDAAHLAAHFSTRREEPTVEVSYALRGRVRKPRGSAPGLVMADHARTMVVRMEPARLKRLLASADDA
jgi:predicted ribosome quality control (RQC) complex YloA/Tae2 family protein